ncbi:hypothetical protein [Acidithiobacillus sp.]|uniref:hypothetical protein n=1 Tax=Acidithiobacillus sp. TaxID=1872118 RepID=UPI003D02C685
MTFNRGSIFIIIELGVAIAVFWYVFRRQRLNRESDTGEVSEKDIAGIARDKKLPMRRTPKN